MNRFSLRLLCQIYALLVLLVATLISAFPYSMLALALLLVMLFITVYPLQPRFQIAITMVIIFLLPVTGASVLSSLTTFLPIVTQTISALLILPLIYLIDDNLKKNAPHTSEFIVSHKVRHTTKTFAALFISTLVLTTVAFALGQPVLLFSGIIFALYLLGIIIKILLAIPRLPIVTHIIIMRRIIAGTTANIPVNISSKASETIYGSIASPEPWIRLTPQRFTINQGEIKLNLSVTPPLAGPSRPQCQVSIIDSRGLVQINQAIEFLELQVIPRAKYATWLASKYLEQIGTGVATATALPTESIKMHRQGMEYLESRSYQAGDQLKYIDWKHTLKLGQLITKEYAEDGKKATIIAVNLSVSGAEEADILAFNLITAALTLAQEGIRTALTAYNHKEVILTTLVSDPDEILAQAMLLIRKITSIEFYQRHLEQPDLAKLRRNITHLKKVESEPARQLLGLLNFEYQAIEESAKNHPATLALTSVTEHTPVPAIILLISPQNHDAEALLMIADRLTKREFTTIALSTTQP